MQGHNKAGVKVSQKWLHVWPHSHRTHKSYMSLEMRLLPQLIYLNVTQSSVASNHFVVKQFYNWTPYNNKHYRAKSLAQVRWAVLHAQYYLVLQGSQYIICLAWECTTIIAAKKAKKLLCPSAMVSDDSSILLDLQLTILTLQVEKKPLLSLLSIGSSPVSEKGGRDQQIKPELLNEAFSAKATQ